MDAVCKYRKWFWNHLSADTGHLSADAVNIKKEEDVINERKKIYRPKADDGQKTEPGKKACHMEKVRWL